MSVGFEIRELSEEEKALTGRKSRLKYPFPTLKVGGPAMVISAEDVKNHEGSIRSSAYMWGRNQTNKTKKPCRLFVTKNIETGELLITRVE